MNDSQKYIKNLISSNDGLNVVQNTPIEYSSRQKQYLSNRTKNYASKRAYLSSDFVQAEVQGISQNFEEFITTNIRLADIISPSATSTKRTDDYKQILIPNSSVNYLPIGAKINTMGNTWLVINPSNISTTLTTSVIARCNATYNSYDYYGNVITEPIVVEKYAMSSNDNENSLNIVLMDGYFNITCQMNDNTENLGINKRIFLGNKPYHITGFTDFIQEFTNSSKNSKTNEVSFSVNAPTGELEITYPDNYVGPTYKLIQGYLYEIDNDGNVVYIQDNNILEKVPKNYLSRLITFTVRIDEPNANDDLINFIADGNSYQVSAELNGLTELIAGTQTLLTPSFLINGEEVESTRDYPLTWQFTSNNENIATINSNGLVTAYNSGTVQIVATLTQNPSVTAMLELVVTETLSEPYIVFDGFTVDYISQYDSAMFTATYFENNLATNYPLNWSFSGPTSKDYIATVSEDGKSVSIECLSASETPLTIQASYNGYTAEITINLVGY